MRTLAWLLAAAAARAQAPPAAPTYETWAPTAVLRRCFHRLGWARVVSGRPGPERGSGFVRAGFRHAGLLPPASLNPKAPKSERLRKQFSTPRLPRARVNVNKTERLGSQERAVT